MEEADNGSFLMTQVKIQREYLDTKVERLSLHTRSENNSLIEGKNSE